MRKGIIGGLHKIGLSLTDWNPPPPLILTIFSMIAICYLFMVRESFRRYEVRLPGMAY